MKTLTPARQQLPKFSQIELDQVETNLDHYLAENKQKINELVKPERNYTWQSLMQPLEDLDDRLDAFWSLISHLHAVLNSEKLRQVYHACLPKLADYQTEISHNQALYQAISSLSQSEEYQDLDRAQHKVIDDAIRDFQLAGVSLPSDKKAKFAEIAKQLSKLTSVFEDNVLDATQAWFKQVIDESELTGIPTHALAAAKQAAQMRQLPGAVFTLEVPSYAAVVTYADSRALREEMYHAYVTRASDKGPNANQFDNSEVMEKILQHRLALANLLDFKNYAEYALATRMVKSTTQAIEFLQELVTASLPQAQAEFAALSEFARSELKLTELKPWDIAYASEKLRQSRYAISPEDLRPYFPQPQVLQGLFAIANRLFGISVELQPDVDVWHPDVRCYAVYDETHQLRSYFYIDLYARENKRGGAWMDECRSRRRLPNGEIQIPIAFLTCNFTPPIGDQPALFTHDEVITLFHEFGHTLQHMLTTVDYRDVSGINGIPWDAVELPSQFLENWAWQKTSLALIAKHYQTGAPLPDDLFQRMLKAKNFQSGMQMMRQLEFAIFDMRLHTEFDPQQKNQIQQILDEVRAKVSVVPVVSYNRFQNSFSHIFAGGYAAGYYSYKWAEVMAADAFSLFEEKGMFDRVTARKFLHTILESGGSQDPMILFKTFRGREPRVDALLKQNGIKS
jgi:oligopeptidase A